MTVFTYSEARQKFSSVLNKANQEGSGRSVDHLRIKYFFKPS